MPEKTEFLANPLCWFIYYTNSSTNTVLKAKIHYNSVTLYLLKRLKNTMKVFNAKIQHYSDYPAYVAKIIKYSDYRVFVAEMHGHPPRHIVLKFCLEQKFDPF